MDFQHLKAYAEHEKAKGEGCQEIQQFSHSTSTPKGEKMDLPQSQTKLEIQRDIKQDLRILYPQFIDSHRWFQCSCLLGYRSH